MFNIAVCYEDGYIVDADPKAAFAWYGKAAETGYDLGMFNLARCYMAGIGTPENKEQSFYWMNRVAETGNSQLAALDTDVGSDDGIGFRKRKVFLLDLLPVLVETVSLGFVHILHDVPP